MRPHHLEVPDKPVILGTSGTQVGGTAEQRTTFGLILRRLRILEFHHGDCVGWDEQAHNIVIDKYPKCHIEIHPPKNRSKRAFCKPGHVRDPLEYLTRNRVIVTEANLMVITPKEEEEQLRSGTWATFRYSRQAGKTTWVILPDGDIWVPEVKRGLFT